MIITILYYFILFLLSDFANTSCEQAHIWEGYAFRDKFDPLAEKVNGLRTDGPSDDKPKTQTFKDRAISPMTGDTPSSPLFYQSLGDGQVDWSLFNEQGDNSALYIMTVSHF